MTQTPQDLQEVPNQTPGNSLKHFSMKDLIHIKESCPNQKLDDDIEFILSKFNYFGNCAIFKDSLNLGYIKESLPNPKLDKDFNFYSRFFKFCKLRESFMIP